jgi:hypothetical protein
MGLGVGEAAVGVEVVGVEAAVGDGRFVIIKIKL